MKKTWALVWALPLLAVAACDEEAPDAVASETGGEAAGEVLGGTISDDMIPLEELTSTSPPAERSPSPSPGDGAPASEPDGPVTAGPAGPEPETPEEDIQ